MPCVSSGHRLNHDPRDGVAAPSRADDNRDATTRITRNEKEPLGGTQSSSYNDRLFLSLNSRPRVIKKKKKKKKKTAACINIERWSTPRSIFFPLRQRSVHTTHTSGPVTITFPSINSFGGVFIHRHLLFLPQSNSVSNLLEPLLNLLTSERMHFERTCDSVKRGDQASRLENLPHLSGIV